MNLEEFNIIVFVTGAIVGFVIALVFKSITKSTEKESSNSNSITIKSLQQELDKKQVIIDNFFSDSNGHLIAAEKRIAEMRKTLADGASQLSNVNITGPAEALNPETSEESLTEAPKDYALKEDSEQGMLSEQFGLKKVSESLEPKRTI